MTEETSATKAASGGVYVLFAKVFFVATGFVQQTLLQRFLGDETYGALSRVMASSNIPNNVMVASSTQGVSRAIASAHGSELATLRLTTRVHVTVSLVVAVMFALAAPVISWTQNAPHILGALWVMAPVLAVYGIYAALVGYLNGRALFAKQASLDVLAATLRTIGLLAFGLLATRFSTSAIVGATTGAAAAIACVFALAIFWVWRDATRSLAVGRNATPLELRVYCLGLLPVIGAQAFTSALMQSDLLLLGHFLKPPVESPHAPDVWVAAYRGAQLFAFLPYQLLFSVTQVLFPMLAKTKVSGTPADVAALVTHGARVGVVVLTMLVCVVATLPASLLRFGFTEGLAVRGTETLRALALGQGCFALLGLACTVLVSLGYERRALLLTGTALALVLLSTFAYASRAEFGADMSLATARATSAALAAAALAGIVVVRFSAGAFAPWRTLIVSVALVGTFWTMGHWVPMLPRPLTVLAAGAVFATAGAALFVLGELKKSDIMTLVDAIARRRGAR